MTAVVICAVILLDVVALCLFARLDARPGPEDSSQLDDWDRPT